MYDRTFVKTPSFWYGLKRPAVSGRENTMPAPNADATSSASTAARAAREDLLLGSIVEPPAWAEYPVYGRRAGAARGAGAARSSSDGSTGRRPRQTSRDTAAPAATPRR